jgi:hypothetical protein
MDPINLAILFVGDYGVYHTRKQTKMMAAQTRSGDQITSPPRTITFWKTPGLYALFLLALLAWTPSLINIYFAHERLELISYGLRPPLTFTGILTAAPLMQYKDDYRVMLVVRMSYGNVDRMRDRHIEKSIPYTIDGPALSMVIVGQLNPLLLHIQFDQPTIAIEYDAILIPNQVMPDDITSLSDVDRLHGKILDSRVRTDALVALGVKPANQLTPLPGEPCPAKP